MDSGARGRCGRPAAGCWSRTRRRPSCGACRARSRARAWPTRFFLRRCSDRRCFGGRRGCRGRGRAVDESDFTLIQKLMRDRAGIQLDSQKHYLVDARLETLARRERLPSVSDLCARLRSATGDTLRRKVLDVMVTTETSFFRDVAPFDALRRTILPDLLARRLSTRQLTIWSGASSSGQEIYSIALLLREHFGGLPGWDVRLVASDLSRD